MLTNISANHEYTRLIINRGLLFASNKLGGLAVKVKGDSPLLYSVYNKHMVRNSCFPRKYASWSRFLMYTCNQKAHFGTSPINN